MNSLVATSALLLWPLVAVACFMALPATRATIWVILGAQLLLPVGEMIKFEMVPQLDKATIPSLCIFVAYLVTVRRAWRPRFGLAEILVLMFLLGPVATSTLNNDPVFIGDRVIPGVGIYDAGSAIGIAILTLMPFFVGRGLLRGVDANQQVLNALVVAGLLYSIPMLFEIRFSPQLHEWVYGYYPSDFIQQMRDGGFRPMVFMGHGLIAAIFLCMTLAASAALWRTKTRVLRLPSAGIVAYLGIVLVLCKSAGAAVLAALIVPLIGFGRLKVQSYVAIAMAVVALSYPLLRFSGLVPTDFILNTVQTVSVDRASSLGLRFENEDRLLEHAFQRPLWGWGRYGRSRVYDEDGRDITVTDGRWIITLGQFGLVGFLAEFGLLALCVIRAARAYSLAVSFREKSNLVALSLILATNVVDSLPNASLLPITWLLAGALLGRAEDVREPAGVKSFKSSSSRRLAEPTGSPHRV
ncbi:O-antigen ligase [Bradyrhizobium lablabi]|uniref:O-antigen ligase family protein n=1 Tax=Bradyrhizobium lablabi TaxID=722472 RepID=UPI001BA95559|nr:hypothetical protein [Bradyrhizobium lablabi]MBR0697778.1 hypothetical protein [Bradyrhizobium lablabi]